MLRRLTVALILNDWLTGEQILETQHGSGMRNFRCRYLYIHLDCLYSLKRSGEQIISAEMTILQGHLFIALHYDFPIR
jgi:hypothetical protein